MSNAASWSGPGLILSRFSIEGNITPETLRFWLNQEYVPALQAKGLVKAAWFYEAANSGIRKQHLVVYKVADLALVRAGAFRDVPRTSEQGLFDGSVDDSIDLESRIYSIVQLYETSKQSKAASPTIIVEMIQPEKGGEANLEAWYREEHNQQRSGEPGWRRTARFSLLTQYANGKKSMDGEMSSLAIHEYMEGHTLGKDVKVLEPESDWTKKVMGNAEAVDSAIYNKVRDLGAAEPEPSS